MSKKDGVVGGVTQIAKRKRGRPPAAVEDLKAAHAAARERICDAALDLFDRGGIESISMREIAGAIGVSPMMPYKYFPTKDHLLQELRTRAFQTLETTLRAATRPGNSERDARAKLERVLVAYLEFGLTDRRAYRLMFDYWAYDNPSRMIEDFGDTIRRQSGAWNVLLETVEECFLEISQQGDPLTSAHLIWAGVHGLVSLEASRKLVMGMDFQELITPTVQAILNGFLRPQASAASKGTGGKGQPRRDDIP